jgi:hypothetical protein
VEEAASSVGGSVTLVRLSQSSAPVIAYTLAAGEKAKLGTITFP